jgi:hypothetical protein
LGCEVTDPRTQVFDLYNEALGLTGQPVDISTVAACLTILERMKSVMCLHPTDQLFIDFLPQIQVHIDDCAKLLVTLKQQGE